MTKSNQHKECAEILGAMVFAYINKDEFVPHDFEFEALERAVEFLKKHYKGKMYNPKMFEQHLHDMKLYYSSEPEYEQERKEYLKKTKKNGTKKDHIKRIK